MASPSKDSNDKAELSTSWRRTPSYECLEEIASLPNSSAESPGNLVAVEEGEKVTTLSLRSYDSILEDSTFGKWIMMAAPSNHGLILQLLSHCWCMR